jgi:hypothetical protein
MRHLGWKAVAKEQLKVKTVVMCDHLIVIQQESNIKTKEERK